MLTRLLKFKIILICHRSQRHRWCNLSCEYLREFLNEFETVLMMTNGVREAGRPRTATPTALRRPLRRHSPLPTLLHAAHWQQRGQGVHPPAHTLYGPYRAAWAAQGQGLPYRRRPLPGAAAARRVHFAPLQPREPHREPFFPRGGNITPFSALATWVS